jgi:hypothetical protein
MELKIYGSLEWLNRRKQSTAVIWGMRAEWLWLETNFMLVCNFISFKITKARVCKCSRGYKCMESSVWKLESRVLWTVIQWWLGTSSFADIILLGSILCLRRLLAFYFLDVTLARIMCIQIISAASNLIPFDFFLFDKILLLDKPVWFFF